VSTEGTLVVAAGVAIILLTLTIGAIVVGRVLRQHNERRDAARRELVAPLVLAWTESESEVVSLPTKRADREAATDFAIELVPKLRGADRDAIVGVLMRLGVATRARHDAQSRFATRRLRGACALDVLAQHADADVFASLLVDRNQQIRIVAARAVGRIGLSDAVPLLMKGVSDRTLPANTVSMAIVRIGPTAATLLLPSMRSHDPLTRSIAAELLGYLDATSACRRLIEALGDTDVSVATAAATALGRLQLTESEMALRHRLAAEYATDHPDLALCMALVAALGRVGDRRAIPILTASLHRSHRLSRVAAAALETMGTRRSRSSELARSVERASRVESSVSA
jgi:HEAT repeat protein